MKKTKQQHDDLRRAELLSRLESMKEAIAAPTVQTMDMGLEHIAASSKGGATVLGRYGAWPMFGPLELTIQDFECLERLKAGESGGSPLAGVQLQYFWQHVEEMFEYAEMDANARQVFLRSFAAALLKQRRSPNQTCYLYFDKYEPEPPRIFLSRGDAVDYFMSSEDLTPWDEMSTDELEMWSDTLDEITEFAFDAPAECNDGD